MVNFKNLKLQLHMSSVQSPVSQTCFKYSFLLISHMFLQRIFLLLLFSLNLQLFSRVQIVN